MLPDLDVLLPRIHSAGPEEVYFAVALARDEGIQVLMRRIQDQLSLLDEIRYDSLFSFKYSPRPNTPSLSMPDAISEEEKSRRLAVLQEKQREIQGERNATLVGTSFDVFVSGKSRRENQWSGQTSCHRVINFTSQRRELLGTYVQVLVTGAGPNSLVGEQVT